MTPNNVGASGELYAQYRMATWGITSGMPAQHASAYDLMIEHAGDLYTVQVKSAGAPGADGSYRFHTGGSDALLWCNVAVDKEVLTFEPVPRASVPAHRMQRRWEHQSYLLAVDALQRDWTEKKWK